MNMHGHSNRNVIFICTTDQGYGDVNAGEHNHQRFGPVPEQFLYNPGEDILLSTEEEILRFYTENGRGVLLGRAVTVLRTGGYLIIKDGLLSVSKLSAEFRRNDIKISDLFLSNYPGGTAPKFKQIQNLKETIYHKVNRRNPTLY